MSQSGMMSFRELQGLDIREFFITLVNWEKQLDKRKDGES
jgi:hypothetical protein